MHPGAVALSRTDRGELIPRRIAFINEKGGSGKTTLVANLAVYLARERDRRTLAIDMDPQGQLGKVLGLEVRHPRGSSIELLIDSLLGDAEAQDRPGGRRRGARRSLPVSHTRIPNLDVIVSNKSLALLPLSMDAGGAAPGPGVARTDDATVRKLARALAESDEVASYDFVLLDAPPTFGPLTLSVLLACDEVAVPVPLTYLALDGFAELQRTIAMVRERYDHRDLHISMVIPTFYRRTRLAHEILEKLSKRFPAELAQTTVGFHVKIDEAQSHGLSIFEYAPSDRGAKAMADLALELEARGAVDAAPALREPAQAHAGQERPRLVRDASQPLRGPA